MHNKICDIYIYIQTVTVRRFRVHCEQWYNWDPVANFNLELTRNFAELLTLIADKLPTCSGKYTIVALIAPRWQRNVGFYRWLVLPLITSSKSALKADQVVWSRHVRRDLCPQSSLRAPSIWLASEKSDNLSVSIFIEFRFSLNWTSSSCICGFVMLARNSYHPVFISTDTME